MQLLCAPEDEWWQHPKHVEQCQIEINSVNCASCWNYMQQNNCLYLIQQYVMDSIKLNVTGLSKFLARTPPPFPFLAVHLAAWHSHDVADAWATPNTNTTFRFSPQSFSLTPHALPSFSWHFHTIKNKTSSIATTAPNCRAEPVAVATASTTGIKVVCGMRLYGILRSPTASPTELSCS